MFTVRDNLKARNHYVKVLSLTLAFSVLSTDEYGFVNVLGFDGMSC